MTLYSQKLQVGYFNLSITNVYEAGKMIYIRKFSGTVFQYTPIFRRFLSPLIEIRFFINLKPHSIQKF